jgi:serine/threonine-protein kinase
MGRVFLARQHSLDREVAIKTVRDSASESERLALLSEGAITGHLEHPSVIPVHALGVDEAGRPVLVMKRVEGVEWGELLSDPGHPVWEGRGGPKAHRLDDHLEIFMHVCNAVHFAHSRGIVHRDIKPQNVFIGRYGEVYLGDWGLALRPDQEPGPQPLCGTPGYMAPEMALSGVVTTRTDVYLLGATLHQILTGEPRHVGSTMDSTVFMAARSEPFAYEPDVPAELAALANRATSPDPADRPASAAEIREDVTDYLRHKASIALGHSAAERVATLRELTKNAGAQVDEAVHRDVEILCAETEFALNEALRQWPGNPVAGQARVELDAVLASRRARAAELERLARDLDPTISSRQRGIGHAALAIVGVALSVRGVLNAQAEVTPKELFLQSLAPLGVSVLATAAFRRQLFGTAFNARVVVTGFGIVGGITADRALGLVTGASSAEMLVHDSLLAATVGLVCAAFLFRWVVWAAFPMLAAAAVAAAAPEQAMRAFSLGSGTALLTGLFFVWRAATAAAR